MNDLTIPLVGRFAIGVGLLLAAGADGVRAQGHHGHGGFASSRYGGHHPGPGPYLGPGNGGLGGGRGFPFRPPILIGFGGVYLPTYVPVPVPFPVASPMAAGPVGGGLMLPAPSAPPMDPVPPARPKARPEPSKSQTYITLGDNLFRAGNNHRAEQRYVQAVRADPGSAKPRVRLAQLALVRGDYAEAAEQFRAASTAEPGWLINAADVQALFAEPADFARALAKLETHLQASPNDRDGWLVLGAEWYLSGRAHQAADVFTRLNDRKPDATLAAFLDATAPDPTPRPQD